MVSKNAPFFCVSVHLNVNELVLPAQSYNSSFDYLTCSKWSQMERLKQK